MPATSLIATKSVILVDDDDDVRRSFSFLLNARGFSVSVFKCGRELLDLKLISDATCFLLDYRLPDMNGIDLLHRLRGSGHSNPALLITGDPRPSIRPRAFAAGYLDVMDKPVDAGDLAEAINSALTQTEK